MNIHKPDLTILATGSRDWTDREKVYEVLSGFPNPETITLMHGDAKGLDRIAGQVAKSLGMRVHRFPAQWKRYGRAAGPIRNAQMLDEKPDLVIAFPLPQSRGTWHCIQEAKKRGLEVKIVEGD